jgi:methyl-accepting chemotaxis protein
MALEKVVETRFGIRAKFVVAFALLTLVSALIIVGIDHYRLRGTIRSLTLEQAGAIADTVQSTGGSYVSAALDSYLQKITDDLAKNPSVQYVDFVAADGRVMAHSGAQPPAEVTAQQLGVKRQQVDLNVGQQGGQVRLHLFIVPFFEGSSDNQHPRGWFRLLVNDRRADEVTRAMWTTNVLVVIIAIIIAVGLAVLASSQLVRPILVLSESAQRIASGDLTHRTAVTTEDEIGSLGESFNSMAANLERTVKSLAAAQQKLKTVVESVSSRSRTVMDRVDEQRSIIGDMYSSIDHLNGGVRKITDNVEALSASSEETSSSMLEMVASMEEVSRHTDTLWTSVEDTASATSQMVSSISEVDQNVVYLTNFVTDTSSSMVEMSASIGQVESNAALSYNLAVVVAEAAESGMKAVRETIDGMEQIRKSVVEANAVVSRLGDRSVAIGKILNVIEDVAEQTNLLALNAAILAAQAGEYGKGFSVVAAEIRELSERTASSTRDIANLIRAVQDEVSNALQAMSAGSRLVEDGVSLSHEAGRALNNILESAAKSSDMGKEIANATREQTAGSENVTRAVDRLQSMAGQINSATRQQAQGSEHIMHAVESMREVTKYVRQAMIEQRTGSGMISAAAERMIDMIHEIFQVAANQSQESERIVATMEQVRTIAEGNRTSASEMIDSVSLLNDAIRSLDEEVRKFRVRA